MMHGAKAIAVLVALGLVLGLLPLGCGGATGVGEDYTFVQLPSGETAAASDWQVPELVVDDMRSCVKEHASALKTHAHVTKFDLAVTEGGDVQKVMLRSSTLHHDALESCLMRALTKVSIPSSVLTIRSSEPMSGGESSRESRGPLGVAHALGGLVAIAPIAIIALGVTVTVYVAAAVTEELREAAKRRDKIERLCGPPYYECWKYIQQPDWNIDYFGPKKDCLSCLNECRKDEGLWPNYKCPPPNWRPN